MILYWAGLIGVGVFAVSGALAAGRKNFDWLGVVIIAFVTALGGGTLRDVLLDQNPILWIHDTTYVYVVLASAALTLVYVRYRRPPLTFLLVADALGLALFSIGGAQIAESQNHPAVIVILMGTITGAIGGVMRDVLCGEVPILLRPSELYATTAIVGTAVYLTLEKMDVAAGIAALVGMFVIAIFRISAIVWQLKLPVFSVKDDHDS